MRKRGVFVGIGIISSVVSEGESNRLYLSSHVVFRIVE